MLVTVRQELPPEQRLDDDALRAIIGKVTSVNWPGGPSKARIAAAEVVDHGAAVNITLEVAGDLQEFLAHVLTGELSGL